MEYIIAGFVIVLWFVAAVYLCIKVLNERIENNGIKWTLIGSVFLIMTFALMLYITAEEEKDCKENGGQMVKTGTQTTFIMSGNVMIPITSDKKDCLK